MAILASLVDSTIDQLAQGVLMWANRASVASDGVEYPAGRSRLEPVGVVTCALLMAMASLQVIHEASAELIGAWASGTSRPIALRWLDAGVMLATVFVKAGLYFWCRAVAQRTSNVTVDAVAQDNLNDVLSNSIALVAALSTQLRPSFWVCTFLVERPSPNGSETRTRALRNTRIKGPLPSTPDTVIPTAEPDQQKPQTTTLD
jgi:divalent metal cation (Fe/Co/Zn/Cd) transporter